MKNRIQMLGKGIPVVLVHGMGGPKIWSPVAEKLKQKFQVIRPIFPGFLSEDTMFSYSDKLYVDFLVSIRKYLKIESWNVVGISMGGRTSINYSLRESNHISSLTLIDSIGVGYMSPILRLPVLRRIFPAIIYRLLSNTGIRGKMTKQDFVNQDREACKDCVIWFNDMVKNKTIRTNFAKILSRVGARKKSW